MAEGDSLPQAWQWLVPPVVDDGRGRLIPRKHLGRGTGNGDAEALKKQASVDSPNCLLDVPDARQNGRTLDKADSCYEKALLVHPSATHQAYLKGMVVAYLLRRSTRRTIGFSVGVKGLEVTAPQWVALKDVESALQTKADWIVRKLRAAGSLEKVRQEARILWGDGGSLDYLGQPMTLRLNGEVLELLRPAQTHREQSADGSQTLYVPLSAKTSEAQVRAAVHAWMLREARVHFTARLLHFSPLLDVRWSALRLSNASTRWGSASSEGVIRLNWRLMQHSPSIIDYVVVHELAHLRHMDHSPRFWAVVAEVLPDWRQLRRALRDKPLPAWGFGVASDPPQDNKE